MALSSVQYSTIRNSSTFNNGKPTARKQDSIKSVSFQEDEPGSPYSPGLGGPYSPAIPHRFNQRQHFRSASARLAQSDSSPSGFRTSSLRSYTDSIRNFRFSSLRSESFKSRTDSIRSFRFTWRSRADSVRSIGSLYGGGQRGPCPLSSTVALRISMVAFNLLLIISGRYLHPC